MMNMTKRMYSIVALVGFLCGTLTEANAGESAPVGGKSPLEYEQEFADWLRTHHITFHDAVQYAKHLETYISNDLFIMAHNAAQTARDFTLGHNEFSHLTSDEFKARMLGYRMPEGYLHSRLSTQNMSLTDQHVEIPNSIDWVQKGGVTPVKNQGHCGSCWAFSTTGAVEGATFVATGVLPSLSEQELVDCDHNGDMGCNGGLMDHAFSWIESRGGICGEEEYSYHANESVCRTCKEIVKVTGFQDVQPNNEQALKLAVAQQPVSVAIEADEREFQFYKSGVFTKSCGTELDHGVLVVGYGEENGEKFWKVKNSWGPKWGEEGFIRLSREADGAQGKCGIAMVPSYPFASLIKGQTPLFHGEDESRRDMDDAETTTSHNEQSFRSSASVTQCGDKKASVISFEQLDITPKEPKRGKPVVFFGKGEAKQDFASANFKMIVKLAGAQVYAHSGVMCGSTHIPLPLGLGHIDVHGFECPMKKGNFDGLKVDVNLPVIAPTGNYEIQLVSGEAKDGQDDSLFCVHVELELGNDEQSRVARVYEFIPGM